MGQYGDSGVLVGCQEDVLLRKNGQRRPNASRMSRASRHWQWRWAGSHWQWLRIVFLHTGMPRYVVPNLIDPMRLSIAKHFAEVSSLVDRTLFGDSLRRQTYWFSLCRERAQTCLTIIQ